MASKKNTARGVDGFAPRKTGNKRRTRNRVVYVLTEGTLTEPMYIDLVRELATKRVKLPDGSDSEPNVNIENDERTNGGTKGPKNPKHSRKPKDLVEHALRIARKQNREGRAEGLGADEYPVVWCLFDRDQHEGIDECVEQVKRFNANSRVQVRIAYSHPCFELWRLLHHQPFTSTFGGVCDDAAERLRRASKQPGDVKVVLGKYLGRYTNAKKHAEQINKQWADHHKYTKRDPYTDVSTFVEEGLHVLDYGPPSP
ncbi:RloB family protein [Kitasatospora purpeofusca]|uniref:RloB family protein n=1 Tax=Kitasatospora purpeofusca TaxID=67352 RepID=UPI0036E40BA3